jgi:hypothetical protein
LSMYLAKSMEDPSFPYSLARRRLPSARPAGMVSAYDYGCFPQQRANI